MNELYYALIMITIIIVLILVFVLLSYFYNSYTDNKVRVNSNFKKTATYINDTNTTITDNIASVDSKYDKITTKTNSDVTSLSSNLNSYINTTNPLLSSFSSNLSANSSLNTNTQSNLFKFDNNLKQYFEFKSDNNSINDALYNYNFGITPNLSLSLLKKIDVASGMTIKTNTNDKSFRICDDTNSNSCIDLNVNNGNFNIYPSTVGNINNLNIKKSGNGRVLANFDFNSNSIYLGGTGEDAGLYIKEDNVYMKNLNLLSNNTKFDDTKVMYDNTNPSQAFNTYRYNLDDIKKINNFIAQPPASKLIIGNYSISPTTSANTEFQLDIYIKSKYQIPAGTILNIELFEITAANATLLNINPETKTLYISNMVLAGKVATASIISAIPPNTTIQFRYIGTSIVIDPAKFPVNTNRAFVLDF